MRETEFIKQNKEKWQEFERILNDGNSSPEDLSRVFVETTDDLSYARTRYKNRSVRVYLNGIAQRIFQQIYSKNKDQSKNSFWLKTAPSIIYKSRREMLIATLVFLFSVGIGLFSAHNDPEFCSIMLGEGYVEMTKSNIENGDPMAVYKDADAVNMFLMIATNNIRVSFLVFVMGVFFSLGTLMGLLYNGAMVGAFIYFFIERDLFKESFLTIMLHGTLELSCIALAGAAGLMLGRGLLFPGTYSRLQAFLISARKGITIMISIVPFLIVAALIESFATRHTEAPDIMRIMIIILSLAIVIGYYVILPKMVVMGGNSVDIADEIQESSERSSQYDQIKSIGKVFTEAVVLLKKNLAPIARIAGIGALISTVLFGLQNNWDYAGNINSDFFTPSFGGLNQQILNLVWFPDDIYSIFNFGHNWLLIFSTALTLTAFSWFVVKKVRGIRPESEELNRRKTLIVLLCWSLLQSVILALPMAMAIIISLLLMPALLQIPIAAAIEGNDKPLIRKGMQFASKRFWSNYGLIMVVLMFLFTIMFLINAPVSYLIFDFILSNFKPEWTIATQIPYALYAFLALFIIYGILALAFIGIGIQTGSNRELLEANQLKMQINEFGKPKTYYGIEREEV